MAASRVDSVRADVRSAVDALIDAAIDLGTTIHPTLRVVEVAGQLSVHADAPDGETLIALPEELLVPIADIQWESADDRLAITSHGPGMTTSQRTLADALVAVYNATDKLEWTRVHHPAHALGEDAAVLEALRSLGRGLSRSRTLVDRFLGTRAYDHHGTPVLLPVVELLNHHRDGAQLRMADGSMAIAAVRATGGDECFATYGRRRDALDIALSYGFDDGDAELARSVPVVVDVGGVGEVEVVGRPSVTEQPLDLPLIEMADGRVTLSHVTFDARHPASIRAVLSLAAAGMSGQSGAADVTAAVVRAIADANLRVLSDAESVVGASSVPAAMVVARALRTQRSVIERVVSSVGVPDESLG